MKSMTGIALALATVCWASSNSSAAEQNTLSALLDKGRLIGQVSYFMPEKDGYDNGIGADASFEVWMSPQWGLSLGLGYWKWDIPAETAIIGDPTADPYDYNGSWMAGTLSSSGGEVTFFGLGASLLYRHPFNDNSRLIFEAGAKYLVPDSDVEVTANYGWVQGTGLNTRAGWESAREKVEWGNTLHGIASVRFERDLNIEGGFFKKGASIFVGAGYDFDIIKSELTFAGEDAGDATLNAFRLFAGLAVSL